MEETAQQIAEALGESDDNPRTQIAAIVKLLGAEGALALLAQTQKVEEAGGLLVPDGTRRRTPGGVFFLLAREKLTPADRAAIFSSNSRRPPKQPRPLPRVRPSHLAAASTSTCPNRDQHARGQAVAAGSHAQVGR